MLSFTVTCPFIENHIGKTVITELIAEECRSRQGFQTSHFCANRDDPQENSTTAIIRNWLGQLLLSIPELIFDCYDMYKTCPESDRSSLPLPLLRFCVAKSSERLYLIIDGLDEWERDDRCQFLDLMFALVEHCESSYSGKLRFLCVSPDHADIRNRINQNPNAATMTLTATHNAADIRCYSTMAARKLGDTLHPTERHWIVEKICNEADVMFLYAELVFADLMLQPTRQALIDTIKDNVLPTGLRKMYDRMITQLTSHQSLRQAVLQVLGWLVVARRPLRRSEILALIAIDRQVHYDEVWSQEHIIEACGSFVTERPNEQLALVHSTAAVSVCRWIPNTSY